MEKKFTAPLSEVRLLYGGMVKFVLSVLFIWVAMRTYLVIWQAPRVGAVEGFLPVFLMGLRFDAMALAYLLILPALITPFVALVPALGKSWRKVMNAFLLGCFGIIVFLEAATPSFLGEYDIRPNILFVKYLGYSSEVFSTLWAAYRIQLLLSIWAVPAALFLLWKWLSRSESLPGKLTFPRACLYAAGSVLVLFPIARSSLGHRPANPSTVSFSSDAMVNELALNSTYTLAFALNQTRYEQGGEFPYGEIAEDRMLEIIRRDMGVNAEAFSSVEKPILALRNALRPRKNPMNLVIILQESLGAQFVGKLGGKPLTPYLDELADQGIWFERLYATGTRSIRGIEAVVTGFPPTPGESVVKLNKSQNQFFTMAGLLLGKGYDTSFIYGGESNFDNMARFFTGNGFRKVVDVHDYQNPYFEGSWGVSDEDLFQKAHEYFESKGDAPFFSLVFTSSNHSPFEFPDGRIELYDEEKGTVNNAVKYADFAMGKFFEKAMASKYWENTLFLVVADHDARVWGASEVPIEHFQVPGLILGADIEPKKYQSIASQIDLLPTLVSLMGISVEMPAIGRNLLDPVWEGIPGRAQMQYHDVQAFMEGDRVVILRRNVEPGFFKFSGNSLERIEGSGDVFLLEKARAYASLGPAAYRKGWYRFPLSSRVPTETFVKESKEGY